jgi:phosphoglycerate dehydrogenase-like enzyme
MQTGRIAAALGVFADEPNGPPTPRKSDRVVLLPGIAGAPQKTRAALGDLALRNLRGHDRERPLTPVPTEGRHLPNRGAGVGGGARPGAAARPSSSGAAH